MLWYGRLAALFHGRLAALPCLADLPDVCNRAQREVEILCQHPHRTQPAQSSLGRTFTKQGVARLGRLFGQAAVTRSEHDHGALAAGVEDLVGNAACPRRAPTPLLERLEALDLDRRVTRGEVSRAGAGAFGDRADLVTRSTPVPGWWGRRTCLPP